MQNFPLIVTGMHRSGTSMLTRVINLMGLTISNDLVDPQDDNITGFWEDKHIVELNEKILESIGSHHLDPSFLPKGWRHRATPKILAKNIANIMATELNKAPTPWLIKDPRISRLLPIYNELFSTLNVKPKLVIALRHPMEVANSLHKRNNIPIEVGLRLWLQYHLECENFSRNIDRTYIFYPYLLNDWQHQCERISNNLGITWPKSYDETAHDINRFIQPDLRHHGIETEENDLTPEVNALFKHLHQVAEDHCPVNTDLCDAISEQQYNTFMPDLTPGSEQKRVCLVTSDIIGPIKNGGIGTAFYHLAKCLQEAGSHVTILYVMTNYSEQDTINHWVEAYKKEQIEFKPLVHSNEISMTYMSSHASLNYQVYLWLKEHYFDVLYFHEWQGSPFFALQGKALNLAFEKTATCVITHGPSLWHIRHNNVALQNADLLEVNHMEKEAVKMADFVVSPSQYMVDWCMEEGWNFSDRTYVIQNLMNDTNHPPPLSTSDPINEIVFFGRLEIRKGIKLFIEALKRVPLPLLEKVNVNFMGKESRIGEQSSIEFIQHYCKKHLQGTHLNIHFTPNFSSSDAQAYLQQPGKLAIMPSLIENSPYTVKEAIHNNIPFIATDTGGVAELIHEEDRQHVLCKARPHLLAAKIAEAINSGAAIARAAIANDDVKQQWLDLHNTILKYQATLPKAPKKKSKNRPLVSVCLLHFERPHYLEAALASLDSQTYPWLEVIIIDDGSQTPEAISYLEQLEAHLQKKEGWKIIRQENSYMGAARNRAAKKAKGDYILFMDDDNIAMPKEVETLVEIAEATDADITAPGRLFFKEEQELTISPALRKGWVPLGNSIELGLFKNGFADNNALFRRSAFEALSGYTEEYGVGFEDYELFLRAAYEGYKIVPVPEVLYYYRKDHDDSITKDSSYIANRYRVMKFFRERYPELGAAFDRIASVI